MDKFVFNYIYTQVTLSYKRERKKKRKKERNYGSGVTIHILNVYSCVD